MPKKIATLLFVCLSFVPLQARAGDDLAKLGKARVAAAAKAYKVWFDVEEDTGNGGFLGYDLSVRWLHAEIDLATKKEERIASYAAHLQRMKNWKRLVTAMGNAPQPKHAIIDAAQIEAEYWLAKEYARK